MNSLIKRIPIVALIIAMNLCLSACGENNSKKTSSTSYSEPSATTEKEPGQSDINIDTGDVKVRVGDKGVYTKVGDDITVETDEDGARVNVGGMSINVGSGGVDISGVENANTGDIVNSVLSGVSSMFDDDDDDEEDEEEN